MMATQEALHPRTLATLQQLRDVEWFSKVGMKDTDAAYVLSSWDGAVESCASPEWEAIGFEAANQFRDRLAENSAEGFRQWNNIVELVKPASQALVREKTEEVIVRQGLPKVFLDTVDWDILHLLMEAEYADIYAPGWFASQAYWYAQGHFPCGWQGTFPDGKLIIF